MSNKTTLTQRIGDFIKDTVTLDVLTLTGDITLTGAAPAANDKDKKLKWDKLFESVVKGMKASDANKLEIVAYTHAEWDLDSVNFVRKDLEDGAQKLVEAHNSAVESAQKARFEAVKTIASIVGVDAS